MKRTWIVLLAACGGSAAKPPAPVANTQDGIVVLASAPADALVLEVRAIHWACEVTHANGVITSDLRVPAGRPIKLIVATPEGPEQARGLEVSLVGTSVEKPIVKDAPVEIAFRIAKPGTYQWRCPTLVPPPLPPSMGPEITESPDAVAQRNPIKPLTALSAADYDAMLAANGPDSAGDPVTLGAKLFLQKGCVTCHTIDGSPRVGPSWKGIWGTSVKLADGSTRTVDATYVRESVLHPQSFARPGYPPVMPSFEGQLRDHELTAIVDYIESLQ
jgi:cytochrome c oxidase subunit 2